MRGVDIDRYPAIREHLAQWKEDLTPKKNKSTKRGRKPGRYEWYEIQDDVAYWEAFDKPKLIFPDIAKEPRFCIDTGGHYLANTAYCLGTDDHYLLGVLNSRLFWFAISNISIPFGVRAGQYRYRLIYQYMKKVPIRVVGLSDTADIGRRDRVAKLVIAMLDLHKQFAAAKSEVQKSLIRRQINATDAEIDRLVYDLYGLTAEEIAIVEGASELTVLTKVGRSRSQVGRARCQSKIKTGGWFRRDRVHANDPGFQILGHIPEKLFTPQWACS